MIHFILVQNRQGKTRLAKFYVAYTGEERARLAGEVHRAIAPRDQRFQSNFVEVRRAVTSSADWQFHQQKIVYRRYAGLYFCVCVDMGDNELAYLEAIHLFVEILDAYFGNVCELDIVFNFYRVRCSDALLSLPQVYAILDELFLAGEIEETSKNAVLARLQQCTLRCAYVDADRQWSGWGSETAYSTLAAAALAAAARCGSYLDGPCGFCI